MANQDTGNGAADDEEEWRFPLSDFDDDGEGEEAVVVPDATDVDEAGEASLDAETSIEPGDLTLEGAFFMLLGVAFALFVISRLVLLVA